tara:strand:+ start:485 stop:709 length:225 start_codon:yes stop_codon:yes gene_type:complete
VLGDVEIWQREESGPLGVGAYRCIPKENILEAYDFVMGREPHNKHNFLFFDLNPKLGHPSPFRLNYKYKAWLVS